MTNVISFLQRHVRMGVAFGVGVALGAAMVALALGTGGGNWISFGNTGHFAEIVAVPTRLAIPSVGINAPFTTPLSVQADQSIEVPDSFAAVGWFSHGPKPGEMGPAVVLGHVDSVDGPAVFYELRNVSVGDAVEIERADGTVATFVVTRKQYRSQNTFPTAEVYGDLPYAGLRLITCSGSFSGAENSYSHNLIVYARYVKDTAIDG